MILITPNINYCECSSNKICGWKRDLTFTLICANFVEVDILREMRTTMYLLEVINMNIAVNRKLKIVIMISYTSQFLVISVLYRKE